MIPPGLVQNMMQVCVLGAIAVWRSRHRQPYTSPEISAETNCRSPEGPSSNPSSSSANLDTAQSSKSVARTILADDYKKQGRDQFRLAVRDVVGPPARP
jgi:hypothetical protein